MHTTKFINIFLQLNRKEKQNLKLWVNSPIGNSREDVARLFDFIFEKRNIHAENVDRKAAFSYVYQDVPFSEKEMRYLMSFAVQCMEDFLVFYHQQQLEFQKELLLSSIYNQRNLRVYAQQQIGKADAKLLGSNLKDNDFYLYQFQFAVQQYTIQNKNKRYENFNLQSISDNLHYYFIAELLKYTCVSLSFQQISGKSFTFPLLDICLSQIKAGMYENVIPIQLYYLCYILSTNGDESSFHQLQLLLKKDENRFTDSELKDIYLLAINFCIQELNAGKQQYAQYAYDLYLYAIEKGFLLENGELSRFTFKNIAFIGIKKLNAYESVEQFINDYKDRIREEYRENTVLFVRATLYFAKKDYKKAVRILKQIEFEDILWNLDAKSMLLKMHFEEKEYEAMLSLIKSYSLFLHRQKNLGIYKSRYKKVIRYILKLYNNIGKSKSKISQLEINLTEEKELPEKDWFLQQVQKL
ncbi:MAG: hypothetical protein IT271_12865 [Chitinophagales bacterium]|nr:hypothetical protein [Chitinophagales bacterium]